MQQHGSEVLHSHGERADLVSLLLGRSVRRRVSTVHGFVVNSARAQLVKAVHLLLLRRMDRVVAVSEALGSALRRVRRDRLVVLPNAIADRAPLHRTAARERLGIGTAQCVIGWVGRLSPEKRPEHFVEAFRMLDHAGDCRALIVGDGPLAPSLRARLQAASLHERVRLAGSVPDAGALMSAFDLLVLSSSTEGTPMTVLEAMRAGAPVVSTAVGGVPAMLAGDAGWLVPPDSAAALAAAMRDALGDATERARRSERACHRLHEQFSVATWALQHERLYAGDVPAPREPARVV
jgi:glycosyltransferase involved in cell wall biosynthesis